MAEPAIPALVENLRSAPDRRRLDLVWVLVAIGEPAYPALLDLLKLPDPLVRKAALGGLFRLTWSNGFGSATRFAKAIEPRLEEMANDPDLGVRIALANMLVSSRIDSEGTIAVLRTLARDRDPGVRVAVIRAMGQQGMIRATLRPAYLKLLRDEDRDVRVEAATHIPHSNLATHAFIDVLLDMLKRTVHPDPSDRGSQARPGGLSPAVLGSRGPAQHPAYTSAALLRSPTAFAVLKSAATDSDPEVRAPR